MNKCWTTILLILLAVLFCLPAYAQTEPTVDQYVQETQQQLMEFSAELDHITEYLDNNVISQERVSIFDKQLKDILTKSNAIKTEYSKYLQQQEDLLAVLGPAPDIDQPEEDATTKQKRDKITQEITLYQGIVKQADSISFEVKALQDQLVGISLENKAKGLMVRQDPLYHVGVWNFAWQDKNIVQDNVVKNYKSLYEDFIDFVPQQYGLVLVFYLFLAFFIGVLMSVALWKKYGVRRKDALPGTFRKLFTGVIQLLSKAILPLVALWIVIAGLKICEVINDDSLLLLIKTFTLINVVILSHFIVSITLSIHKPSWQIFNLEETSARKLSHCFCIFMILVAFNWYLSQLFQLGILTIDFYNISEFILRIAVCINGLVLMTRRNWRHVSDYTANKYHHFVIYGIKILSAVVFISNPFFIFFGYLQFANAIFLAYIEIVLLLVGLLASHFVAKELLHRLFVGKQREQDSTANVQKLTKKAARHYWVMLFIDLLFICFGAYFILLIVGIENNLIWRYIHPIFSGVKIGHYVFSINILLFAIFMFFLLYFLTRLIQKALIKNVLPHTSLDLSAKQAISQGFGYVGITIAILAGLLALGMNFTNLAIIAGALSVGIGFGLQHIVGNFISGIIMLIERPIKVGDRIIVGQDDGIVKKISVRATEIEDFEKSTILIPNSELISGRVQNWTFHTPLNRIRVVVGVAYGSDVQLVEKLLLEVAQENENVVKEPEPRVFFDDFGDSALIFRLMVYIYDIHKRNRLPSQLRFAIDKKFRENNIHIPFPQRDIHIK